MREIGKNNRFLYPVNIKDTNYSQKYLLSKLFVRAQPLKVIYNNIRRQFSKF